MSEYVLREAGSECKSDDFKLGRFKELNDCASACRKKAGCKFFIYGYGSKLGYCYHEFTRTSRCTEGFLLKTYNFYELIGILLYKHITIIMKIAFPLFDMVSFFYSTFLFVSKIRPKPNYNR